MKIFSKIILAYLSILCFSSCENPNPPSGQLPPITTEGKGTFGYRVDGEVQGQCYDGFFTSLAKAEIVADTSLIIANSCNGYGINIVVNDFHVALASYQLASVDNYLNFYPPEKSVFMSYKNDQSSAVIELLKFDSVQNIISGTFKASLFNEDGHSIEITEGRFDLVYKKY